MKKCSTAALLLAAIASVSAHAGSACEFAADAPDAHRVQPGDTLWDIASLFLHDPWCWTRVWEDNRSEITNPHRIYPGQLIVFDRQAGRLRSLTANPNVSAAANPPIVARLRPSARSTALPERRPIPAIAPPLLESATRFRLASITAAAGAPRIIGFPDSRRLASAGDLALVDGDLPPGTMLDVVRLLNSAQDPDSGKPLALPLLRVGKASYLRQDASGLHRVRVEQASAEIMAGDMLMVATTIDAVPDLRPSVECNGKIAALLKESGWAGPGDVVLLNRGRQDGLNNGNLVAAMKHVRIGANESSQASRPFSHPVATLLIFDVLDQTSLALVMRSNDAISIGDAIGPLHAPD